MTALAIQHKDAFIEGMKQGKNLADTISNLGLSITRQAVSKVLITDPDYQAAKEDWHSARISKAEEMISTSTEQVDVARARAYWQAVTWRAEREHAQVWGAKQQVEHLNAPTINFVFGSAENAPQHAQVIENESQ